MRVLVALGGLLAATSLAWGADIPMAPAAPAQAPAVYAPAPPPVYNWTGVYIGANAGWGFATASATATIPGATATASENLSGFVGGGQVGGDYQIGSWVFGLEADLDYSDQSNTTTGGIVSETDTIPWIGTLRGIVGYAFDRVLVYGTAGGGEGKFTANVTAAGIGSASASRTQSAWTAGAGVEVGITQNLSARLEYLYLDTGNINVETIGALTVTGRVQDNLVRVGLNLRLPIQ